MLGIYSDTLSILYTVMIRTLAALFFGFLIANGSAGSVGRVVAGDGVGM